MEPKINSVNLKVLRVSNDQKKLSEILKNEAKNFCFSTALHGYRFIVLSKRILLERVVWLILCLLSLVTALALLCISWFSFQEVPTYVVTDSTYYPIWNYPFPAVTICSYNLVSKAAAFRLAKNLSRSELAWDFHLLAQLKHSSYSYIPEENYTRLHNLLISRGLSVDVALERVAPPCDSILKRCRWKGEVKVCASIFERVKTSEGFCCAFNYFALRNDTFSAYTTNINTKSAQRKYANKRPLKVSACGYQTGLEVLVNNDPADYFASPVSSVGHKVIIHNPYYFPDWTQQIIPSKMKVVTLISINPTLTYSTEDIQTMSISQRKCLFPEERQLLYFKQYNYHNCMTECRMNLTIKFCGCKPFYYITEHDGCGNKICTFRDMSCLEQSQAIIDSSVPGFDFSAVSPNHVYGSEKSECDCLPDCESTEYRAEFSSAMLNRTYSTNLATFFGGITISNHSVIRVFFKDLGAIKNRRDVTFNWEVLLAFYGGILGLFTGLSFISAIEIFYFFTVRLLCRDVLKYKKSNMELKKLQKHRNTKIRVLPIMYENLEPKKLLLPVEADIRRRNYSFSHMYLN